MRINIFRKRPEPEPVETRPLPDTAIFGNRAKPKERKPPEPPLRKIDAKIAIHNRPPPKTEPSRPVPKTMVRNRIEPEVFVPPPPPPPVPVAVRPRRAYLLAPLLLLLLLPFFIGLIPEKPIVPIAVGPEPFSCMSSSELTRGGSFAIDTNSTINNFDLQAQIRKVTVDVHGPDGSNGLFCINVPKSVMGDQITTFLDSLPANARVEDLGDNFVVSLGYSHSEKKIGIYGPVS